ncbi:two-component system, OmpR family, sensor histidine kinase MtrB [Corynebacterium appendicis CIP 107643]|uniref:Sensor histidine kinase MtrB n=1 Tax=Corynebacterium appendicis CIP 107643 TaxID=1161099 RepID=A0A1N7K1K0_9CORY|nr:Sensor histidine kinase MtrB [Corynebacterium appendicis CIP 107643]SIS55427.1 two-component system, OmpR family, sensor histidine kinase MtrB [Corynebacterium appendicis CIP 107643]
MGTVLIVSAIVMGLLALALASVVTQRLVDLKLENAEYDLERVRGTVEEQLRNTAATGASTQGRLNTARAALAQRSQQDQPATGAYEPVLVVPQKDGEITSPEDFTVPQRLTDFVSQGQVAYQFNPVNSGGRMYDALIIGTPTDSDIPGLQLYLVMDMQSERQTLALMRGLLASAGIVVVVLLVGIAWLSSQQLVAPVRSASRIAERLAAGHLRERMAVEGEDEMARLALSFNDMADNLSSKITQLEEYGDLQRQFTSDVSHELRTPLTTVRMAADMIAGDEENLEPHTRRASQLMMRELDRFEALLADLLEISRHDAGVADLSAATIDARSPIESAWAQTSVLAEELDVAVEFDVPDEPMQMVGDPRRIERIVRNLLANAIDHSEGNPVVLELAANDEAVAITVTDGGVGLKPGQEELVFNRFWRADSSRKRHSGGTGLGLAIAREDAQLHCGTLDAAGTAGVGSQFRLVLPRDPEAGFTVAPLELHAPGAPAEEDTPELVRTQRDLPSLPAGDNSAPCAEVDASEFAMQADVDAEADAEPAECPETGKERDQ